MTTRLPTSQVSPADQRQARSRASWPWIVVALAIGFGKTEAYRVLDHHVWGWAILLGVTSVWSLLRARPVATAIFAAPAITLLFAPHPLGMGVIVGCGIFVALITLFVGIGTLLRYADSRG